MRVNDDRAKRLRLAQNREFTDSVTMPENRLETVGRGISKILEDGKSGLTETEIAIIKARVFEETPLKTLSERFGKSKAGIAYIFDYGLRKIRIRFWDELDISDYR